MRFLMFVCSDLEPDVQPKTPASAHDEIVAWFSSIPPGGHVTGDRLKPAKEAKTVRVRRGKKLVTDGPFTESKEVILGFDILECDTIEDAIEIAARHPMARRGRIEVRGFWPIEE